MVSKDVNRFTEKNFQVPYDCQFIVAQKTDSGFEIYEIFQAQNNLELIYQKIGDWDRAMGIDTKCCEGSIDTYIYARRRKFLSGVEMYVRSSKEKVSESFNMHSNSQANYEKIRMTLFLTPFFFRIWQVRKQSSFQH